MNTVPCFVTNYHDSFLMWMIRKEKDVRDESILYQADEDIIRLASYLSKKKIKTVKHARNLLNMWSDNCKLFHFPASKMYRFIKEYDQNGFAVWKPVGN